MSGPTPTYTQEFKKEVLVYWANSEETAKQVAGHFGVSEYSLYHWRKKFATPRNGDGPDIFFPFVHLLTSLSTIQG